MICKDKLSDWCHYRNKIYSWWSNFPKSTHFSKNKKIGYFQLVFEKGNIERMIAPNNIFYYDLQNHIKKKIHDGKWFSSKVAFYSLNFFYKKRGFTEIRPYSEYSPFSENDVSKGDKYYNATCVQKIDLYCSSYISFCTVMLPC